MHKRLIRASLTEQEYQLLQRLAQDLGKSISVLVREALEKVYFEQVRDRRREAFRSLLSLDAPVSEWSEMEAEIARGAVCE